MGRDPEPFAAESKEMLRKLVTRTDEILRDFIVHLREAPSDHARIHQTDPAWLQGGHFSSHSRLASGFNRRSDRRGRQG